MEYRTIEPDEFDAFFTTIANAFGEVEPEPSELENDRKRFEPDRMFAAIDGRRIVGVTGVFSWRTTVPGGAAVPTAGVTTVGVLPSHRRQGIFQELLRRALEQSRDRGEAIASLFASQAAIYGRFGFATASVGYELDVLTERARFGPGYEPSGTMQLLPLAEALPSMHRVYDAVARTRPGMLRISEAELAWFLRDPPKKEDKPFFALHLDGAGEPDAFAVYTIKHEWPASLPHLELRAQLTMATTPGSTADLWRFLLDVDLVSHVTTWVRPVDEPLFWMLEEPRAIRAKVLDDLHLRPVDVVQALSSRGYAADGELVLRVADPFLPACGGTYRLRVSDGAGVCERSDPDADPDLVCDVRALGSVYLGAAAWRVVERAGLVEQRRDGALSAADAMFASDPAPWCPFMF